MGPKVIDSVDLCRLLGALAFLGITKRALKNPSLLRRRPWLFLFFIRTIGGRFGLGQK
jgi:hypothetical protein